MSLHMARAHHNTGEPRHYLSPLFGWRGAIAESELKASDRLVAMTISLHMNERGGSAFPSVATLARESGLTERSVYRSMARLEAGGWMHVKHGRGGRGRPNVYTATIPETLTQSHPPTAGNPDRVSGNPDTTSLNPDPNDPLGRQEVDSRSLGVVCEKCSGPGWVYEEDGFVSPCSCSGFKV